MERMLVHRIDGSLVDVDISRVRSVAEVRSRVAAALEVGTLPFMGIKLLNGACDVCDDTPLDSLDREAGLCVVLVQGAIASCNAAAAKDCMKIQAGSCGEVEKMMSCFAEADCCQVADAAIQVANAKLQCGKVACKANQQNTNESPNDKDESPKSCDPSEAMTCSKLAASASSCDKAQEMASCFHSKNCCNVAAASIAVANSQLKCSPEIQCKAGSEPTSSAVSFATFGILFTLVAMLVAQV